jgi:LacI family transcriptional regulator
MNRFPCGRTLANPCGSQESKMPGIPRATIKDVAREAKCSIATVSRVLNRVNDAVILEETKQRVLQAAKTVNYQPNRAARTLITGRTNLVVLLTPNIYLPFYASITHQLQRLAQHDGYELIVSEILPNDSTGDDLRIARLPADGILLFDDPQFQIAARITAALPTLPLVCMGAHYASTTNYVGVDLYSSSLDAVRHLYGQDCRRIAHLIREKENQEGDSRRDAYLQGCRETGIIPEWIITPDESRTIARQITREYIEANGAPDGLFCHNDDLAMGAYRAVLDLGLCVPEEVAIVGCDGIEETEFLEKPLSTIMQPVAEMCGAAWQLLRQLMENVDLEVPGRLFQSRFVARASSDRQIAERRRSASDTNRQVR